MCYLLVTRLLAGFKAILLEIFKSLFFHRIVIKNYRKYCLRLWMLNFASCTFHTDLYTPLEEFFFTLRNSLGQVVGYFVGLTSTEIIKI